MRRSPILFSLHWLAGFSYILHALLNSFQWYGVTEMNHLKVSVCVCLCVWVCKLNIPHFPAIMHFVRKSSLCMASTLGMKTDLHVLV